MKSVNKDYVKEYEEFWKGLVETPAGTIDKDKVMRELSDYSFLMEQAAKVYCHVTGGVISKTNTCAEAVISEHDNRSFKDVEEALMEERQELRDRVLAAMRPSGEYVTDLERRIIEAIGGIGVEALRV